MLGALNLHRMGEIWVPRSVLSATGNFVFAANISPEMENFFFVRKRVFSQFGLCSRKCWPFTFVKLFFRRSKLECIAGANIPTLYMMKSWGECWKYKCDLCGATKRDRIYRNVSTWIWWHLKLQLSASFYSTNPPQTCPAPLCLYS